MKACDLFNESETTHEVIVARDDGVIEIYSYQDRSQMPTLRFETKISEQVTGMDVGNITN